MPTATNTPTPAPTATPTPPYPVMPAGVVYQPNCGLAQMKAIIQQPNGRLMNGYRIQLTAGNYSATSPPTGDQGRGWEPGYTEITMDTKMRDGRWTAVVLDPQGNVHMVSISLRT